MRAEGKKLEGPEEGAIAVVTAKSLDSDEVVESVVGMRRHQSTPALQSELIDLVRGLYPGSEFRSFADGAATFLAPKLLIVAVYRLAEEPDARRNDDDDDQQQLFAA